MRQRIKRFQYIFQAVFIGIAYKCGAIALNKNGTVREVAEEASKFFCRNLPLPSRRHLDNSLRVRRIEAECIRDSVLAISGRLDPTPYGPSVLPYLSPDMEGRGKPDKSGPLDGNGRRSIYINVRRNFITSLFLAFDYPIPFSCIGKRTVSNVPAQALAMMNNPFILQQADLWGTKALAEQGLSTDQRIQSIYEDAFARPATQLELKQALDFIHVQPDGANNPQAWGDICHVLMNVKEFIYLN